MKVTTVALAALAVLSGVDAFKGSPDAIEDTGPPRAKGTAKPRAKDYGQFADHKGRKTICPVGIRKKGKCNGTACKIGGNNYPCVFGKCHGPGGGDGACCGMIEGGVHARCPNGLTGRGDEDKGGWGWWGEPERPLQNWFTEKECLLIGPDLDALMGGGGGGGKSAALTSYVQSLVEHDYTAEAMAALEKGTIEAVAAVEDAEVDEDEDDETAYVGEGDGRTKERAEWEDKHRAECQKLKT
ncbi:hypothetical protein CcaCcLH18_09014 [Colletotrichum camelliae]|nr:hypothetical protein CcaCcLH18_09014 [Colletotrichum camelliae]